MGSDDAPIPTPKTARVLLRGYAPRLELDSEASRRAVSDSRAGSVEFGSDSKQAGPFQRRGSCSDSRRRLFSAFCATVLRVDLLDSRMCRPATVKIPPDARLLRLAGLQVTVGGTVYGDAIPPPFSSSTLSNFLRSRLCLPPQFPVCARQRRDLLAEALPGLGGSLPFLEFLAFSGRQLLREHVADFAVANYADAQRFNRHWFYDLNRRDG